ncbi:MAG: XRE family transcriptional regulator [Microbacteriaceae bacterium]
MSAATVDDRADGLGARIRALRRSRSMTLAELAERAGLSHPFLSQLERGLARPSMASLERIVRALGASQLELYAAMDDAARFAGQPAVSLVREHEGVRAAYGLSDGRMLVHGARRFTPIELRVTRRDRGEYFVHEEDEFVYVLSGSVVVDLGDREETVLHPGDALYFAGGIPHRWGLAGEGGECRMVTVKEARR